jgi:glycosyltransferase involved in cell wall biosynthesis
VTGGKGRASGNVVKVFADLRWPSTTGIGVVKEELLRRLPADFTLTDLHVKGRIGSPISPWAIARALDRSGPDSGIFWSPGFLPPAKCDVPRIVTIHDLMHLRFYSKVHAAYYNFALKPLYRKCTAIICVSEFTRQEFLNWSGMPPDRVFMIHNGVSADFNSPIRSGAAPVPYVLYAGNRRNYKNLHRLLRGYATSGLSAKGIQLVLTGDPDRHLQREAESLAVSHMIRFAGTVNHTELIALYREARLVAFVSLSEGFGLPVIEGMAAGVPVLASNVTSIPEIAGDAALLVDPYSVDAIAAGLNRLAFDEDERSKLIRLGHQRVVQFSWDATAARLWAVLRSVAKR